MATAIKKKKLNARDDAIYEFIRAYRRRHNVMPTLRDVAGAMDMSSAGVAECLNRIRGNGHQISLNEHASVTKVSDPSTDRQMVVLNFIIDHIREHKVPPVVREIGAGLGITSPNGVMCHLRALRARGIIDYGGDEGNKSRSIELLIGETCSYCNGLGRVLPKEFQS